MYADIEKGHVVDYRATSFVIFLSMSVQSVGKMTCHHNSAGGCHAHLAGQFGILAVTADDHFTSPIFDLDAKVGEDFSQVAAKDFLFFRQTDSLGRRAQTHQQNQAGRVQRAHVPGRA